MKKNDLQRSTERRISLERNRMKLFTIQVSEDIMLKAAYTAFDMSPEDLLKLRDAYRQEYREFQHKFAEDYKYDKDVWYASELHERDLRLILGDYYEDLDHRLQRPDLQALK